MKASLLTKNRRGQRGAPRVSLFPFLAVLICTMGALVLILFAVMRQARIQAAREATAKLIKQHDECKAERDAVQWRMGQLQESQRKAHAQLADLRLNLGHIEDHARRLRQQVAQLQTAAKKLEQSQREVQQKRSAAQEQLQAVEAQVAEAERRLDAARQAAQNRPRSYAIIPYEGPNETHRRPIYIECRADAVILQPEGVTLRPADFDGPLGPGNPLAAALRAVREHLVVIGAFNPERDGEPYPLMLVRPSGIIAYYAARAGMQSWGADFGYELIGEDWPLQFPPADARLAESVAQAVATARRRQQEIIAAAPIGYRGSRSRPVYRAGPAGGLIREGGPPVDDDDDRESGYDTPGFQGQSPGPRYGNTAGGPGGTGGSGGSETTGGFGGVPGGYPAEAGPAGTATVTGSGFGPGTGGVPEAGVIGGAPGAGTSNAIAGSGTNGSVAGGASNGSLAASGPGGFVQGGVADGTASGNGGALGNGVSGVPGGATAGIAGSMPAGAVATDGMAGAAPVAGGRQASVPSGPSVSDGAGGTNIVGGTSGTAQNRPEGYIPGRPYEAPATPASKVPAEAVASDAPPAMPLRPGEWYPSAPRPPRRPDPSDKDRWDKDHQHGPDKKKIEMSPAEKRGRDWALRNASRGAVPVTRPIRAECYADRMVILPEPGSPAAAPIPFEGRTVQSLDRLVSALWDHMEGWGIAGKGMYWRPVLKMRVAPDAEQRFTELSFLLEGSGVTVQREP
jgi:hypothetical protein